MNSELRSVLLEVRSLAAQREWSDAVNQTDALLSNQAVPSILVTAPAGVVTASFQRWVAKAAPDVTVTVVPLEGLAQDALPAMKVDKLVAVFECGRLLEADAVEAIANAFFCRPAASYAIVLGSAERIDDDKELDLVERGAWRLLVPQPKVDWANQDLLEHRCYLWSDAEPHDFLRPRMQRDKNALATWLRDPSAYRDELARKQVLYVIDLAEEQTYRHKTSVPTSTSLHPQRIDQELETLTHLRQRLLRWLDEEKASVERALITSLQMLEQDLLHQLRPDLQKRWPRLASPPEGDQLQALIVGYITDGFTRWQPDAEQLLTTRRGTIFPDTQVWLQGMDWSLINEVVARNGLLKVYPDALLQDLPLQAELRPIDVRELGKDIRPSPQRRFDLPSVIRGVLGGSLLGAIAVMLNPLHPRWVVAAAGVTGVVVGVASADIVNRLIRRAQSLNECEAHTRADIRAVVREAISQTQEQIRQIAGPLRERLANQLEELEAMLDRALAEASRPTAKATASHPDREVLHAYRQKVLTAVLNDGGK